jgi:hypothetical protein
MCPASKIESAVRMRRFQRGLIGTRAVLYQVAKASESELRSAIAGTFRERLEPTPRLAPLVHTGAKLRSERLDCQRS